MKTKTLALLLCLAIAVSLTVTLLPSPAMAEETPSSAPPTYTLTFNTNCGVSIAPVTAVAGTEVNLSFHTPYRYDDYKFVGWYEDAALTTRVTSITLTEDTTLYAAWERTGNTNKFSFTKEYTGFSDVNENSWYGTANEGVIRDAVRLGIVEGYGDGKYGPEASVKICEVIKAACVIHNIYYADNHTFKETSPWYISYTTYALQNGIIKNGDFVNYDDVCTRAEAAYILANALPEDELSKISTLTPPDMFKSAQYGKQVYLLYAAGVMRGNDAAGTFDASGSFTRAHIAAIITRLTMPETRTKG